MKGKRNEWERGWGLIGAGQPAVRGTREWGRNAWLCRAVASLRLFRSVLLTDKRSAFNGCDLMIIDSVNKLDIESLSIRSS
ncbi:MAG: hypothetical protein RLZZ326_2603 [Planctomycetota bacterium]|jgi:hypothetical protein